MYGYDNRSNYLDDVDVKFPRIRIQSDTKSYLRDLGVEMGLNTNDKVIKELIKCWRQSHPKPKYISTIQQQPEITLPVV
jgi:hypothetical protein